MDLQGACDRTADEIDLSFFDPDAETPMGELAAEAYLAGCGCGCGCAGSAGSAGCVGCAGCSTSGSLACCCCCCCCCFST